MGEPGYVYIMHNCSLQPGQLKIGRTTRRPVLRARELSSTGLPTAFIPLFSLWVDDATAVEKRLHERFTDYRVSPAREFFWLAPQTAIEALLQEAEVRPSIISTGDQMIDISKRVREEYGSLLDQHISRVLIEFDGGQVTLACHIRRGHDSELLRRDLSFITSGDVPYFASAGDPTQAVDLFFELDSYDLIMTTPLFSARGGQLIADVYERLYDGSEYDAKELAVRQVCRRMIDEQMSIEQMRRELNLPELVIKAVNIHEMRGGQFVLTNCTNDLLIDIQIEMIEEDTSWNEPRSWAVIEVSRLDELEPFEGATIGHRESDQTWTHVGPAVRVSGRTSSGKVFDQEIRHFLP